MMLNDEFDKKLFKYFQENKNVPQKTIDSIYTVNLSSKNNFIFFNIKKIIITIISILTLSTGIVFANDITKFIKNLFNDSEGVNTAVENGYVYSIPENIFCTSNNTTSRVQEIIMDDYTLDINMMLSFDESVDITACDIIKIPDLIVYDDSNNIIFKSNNSTNTTSNYINSSCSIFVESADKYVVYYTLNISTSEEKLPKSKTIFIDFNNFEIGKENKTYIFSGNWSNKVNVPSKFYNRTSKILKYNSCTNNNVYKDSICAEVTETCTKFKVSMLWENYQEELEKSQKIREQNIMDSLLIKDNAYIELDNGNKFYASHSSDSDNGYGLDSNGHLNYYQTFDLTKFNLENVKKLKIIFETWNNEKVIIEFSI